MDNILYAVVKATNRQIAVASIVMSNSIVSEVVDTEDNHYAGTDILIFTDRDFLYVPDLDQCLCAGDEIYLDNQTTQRWRVCRGWYSVDDNPAIYGWYLESIPTGKVRSLFLKDFNSLTFVTPRTEFTLPTPIQVQEGD